MKLRDDLTTAAMAIVLFTVVLGLAYPLVMTGAAQLLFPNKADGSQIERGGKVVGSRLLAQRFTGPAYFKPRPSQNDYDPSATFFANLGPNQKSAKAFHEKQLASYLEREGEYSPGLDADRVPVDAVTHSASGLDPHISEANARIQARRVAELRRLPLDRVMALVEAHTNGRFLGLVGEPGVNVTTLNLALDAEDGSR